jgi:hypothetical protein
MRCGESAFVRKSKSTKHAKSADGPRRAPTWTNHKAMLAVVLPARLKRFGTTVENEILQALGILPACR